MTTSTFLLSARAAWAVDKAAHRRRRVLLGLAAGRNFYWEKYAILTTSTGSASDLFYQTWAEPSFLYGITCWSKLLFYHKNISSDVVTVGIKWWAESPMHPNEYKCKLDSAMSSASAAWVSKAVPDTWKSSKTPITADLETIAKNH